MRSLILLTTLLLLTACGTRGPLELPPGPPPTPLLGKPATTAPSVETPQQADHSNKP